jgi:4,5-DOPA dioxygenase extradiol
VIPSVFIGHGSPMIAIEQSEYGDFLDNLGDKIEKPKAIVIFSPHWESRTQMVSDVDEYSTIYDFGGFPDELYRVKYPAKGDHALSQKIQRLLAANGIPYQVEKQRGLDHGAWNILHRIYPKAYIPVIAMSVNQYLTPLEQFRIGKALSSLRQEGVLIVGSGVTVHNFQLFRVMGNPEIQSAARTFEHWVEEKLQAWETNALFDYENQAPYASLAVPPNGREHFVPLFHAMGAASDHPVVKTLHRSWMMKIAPNTIYQFS